MNSPFSVDKKYVDQQGNVFVYIGVHPNIPQYKYLFSRESYYTMSCFSELGVSPDLSHRIREVKPKITRWVNLFGDIILSGRYDSFISKENADLYHKQVTKGESRIACIKIEFEEGEGL